MYVLPNTHFNMCVMNKVVHKKYTFYYENLVRYHQIHVYHIPYIQTTAI
jgi:hypothetical protein